MLSPPLFSRQQLKSALEIHSRQCVLFFIICGIAVVVQYVNVVKTIVCAYNLLLYNKLP